jgi:hypothetical protein
MKKYMAVLLVSLILTLSFTSIAAGNGKLNSTLRLLRTLKERPVDKSLGEELSRALGAEKAVVTVKFDHVLSAAEIAELERPGLSFYYIDGKVARTRAIYPARVPWNRINEVAGRTEVLRMESAYRPAVYPTLNVSGPEVEADAAWLYVDPLGLPLTGRGMRIADFDTGIDVFHPSFFFADGDTLDWLDLDQNNAFTNGVDAVDIDKNGQFGPGEILRFTDGWIYDVAGVWGGGGRSNDDNIYQTWWDWLYADQNNNGTRDFGPAAGFTENDPTFGEPFFIALDDNHNGALDVGERLVALGTSKVYATMNYGSVERLRGTDIILSDDDTNGHGTSVSGILAGGTAGRHIFAGIAPDAELLAGYFFSEVPISYLIPWARARGADAMLYEFGGFVYDFLDGSSLDEELVTIEHETTLQITPSGNLGRGAKHAVATVAAKDSVTLQINAIYSGSSVLRFYCTTLWRGNSWDISFRLKTPAGYEFTLIDSVAYYHNYYMWHDVDTSPRLTHKLDLYIDKGGNTHVMGTWYLKILNDSWSDIEFISNVADDNTSWAGGTEFNNYVSSDKNVTFPATADNSLVNGSYSTRGFEGYGGVGGGSVPVGEISAFSGRGKRIDGWPLLDVCSPGNYDVYTARSHADPGAYPLGGYRQFSGTSAAGPHVAAAVAIVQQAYPNAQVGQVESLINSGAATDAFTGAVYNDTWGHGKLRILGTINVATAVTDMVDGKREPELYIDENYPNPFNPSTWIPFYVPQDGHANITIYNVKGEVITVLRNRWYETGAHSVRWDGTDRRGNQAASGVYFCVLEQLGRKHTRKITLIR